MFSRLNQGHIRVVANFNASVNMMEKVQEESRATRVLHACA